MSRIADTIAAKDMASERFIRGGRKRISRVESIPVRIEEVVSKLGRNVHAVGVGYKVVEGKQTKDISVRFYVLHKLPLAFIPAKSRLPQSIDGLPVDVVESPAADFIARRKACSVQRRRRQRPLQAGISAAHAEVRFGTIGAFCRSRDPEDDPSSIFALSNNHVFGNINMAKSGDPLLQPSRGDGSRSIDRFAVFHRGVRLVSGPQGVNIVDAAIGRLLPQIAISREICSIGRIAGLMRPRLNMKVHKHGRTSAYTHGLIDDVNCDLVVGGYKFINQIRVDPRLPTRAFATAGDSGSLVLTEGGNNAIGLLFAAIPSTGGGGVASPIHAVTERLNITLL